MDMDILQTCQYVVHITFSSFNIPCMGIFFTLDLRISVMTLVLQVVYVSTFLRSRNVDSKTASTSAQDAQPTPLNGTLESSPMSASGEVCCHVKFHSSTIILSAT